jgi:hypothetical protein
MNVNSKEGGKLIVGIDDKGTVCAIQEILKV